MMVRPPDALGRRPNSDCTAFADDPLRSNLLISQSATATASALLSSVASTTNSGTSAMNACPAMVSARSYSRDLSEQCEDDPARHAVLHPPQRQRVLRPLASHDLTLGQPRWPAKDRGRTPVRVAVAGPQV